MAKLTVYVVGLIYFDGCDQPQMRAYAPDGRNGQFTDVPHNASLWIQADQVQDATQWGPVADRPTRSVGGVPFIEFKIKTPVDLEFPDQADPLSCTALDAAMPKLKKEKKKDDDMEPFEIDPDSAETIAKVTIHGGTLEPYEITNKNRSGLVQWTIDPPSGRVITAGDRRITLEEIDAEVVFTNMHEIPLTGENDHLADDEHIQLFKQLMDPAVRENVTLIPAKPIRLPEVVTENKFVGLLRAAKYSDGETPPCCAQFVRHSS